MDKMAQLLAEDLLRRGYSSTEGGTISKEIPNRMPDPRSPFAGYTPEMGAQRNAALEGLQNAANAGVLQANPVTPETDEQTRARIAPFLASLMKDKTLEPAGWHDGTAVPRFGSSDLNFYKKGSGTKERLDKYQAPWKNKSINDEQQMRENYPLVEDMMGREGAQKALSTASSQTQALNLVKEKNRGDLATADRKGEWDVKAALAKPGKEEKPGKRMEILMKLADIKGDDQDNFWADDIMSKKGKLQWLSSAEKFELLNLIDEYGTESGEGDYKRRGIHRDVIRQVLQRKQGGPQMAAQQGGNQPAGEASLKAQRVFKEFAGRWKQVGPGQFTIDGKPITAPGVQEEMQRILDQKKAAGVQQ